MIEGENSKISKELFDITRQTLDCYTSDIRADILMLTYQWLEYCEYCYLTFDQLWHDFIEQPIKHNKINDFVFNNFTAIENWMEYKDYGAQE
jgi:hypothetical protein